MSFIGSALGAGYTSDYTPDTAGQQSQLINPVSKEQAQTAMAKQQEFAIALQGQNGIANQNAAFQGYQGLANGTGPNPAQAQLAQATQANVANQAALAAGQRGASQNVGMMARGAANQGANAQQQAAGQAATMSAQQQMQGLQGMAGISGQQIGQLGQAQQNFAQNALGSIGNYNQAIGGLYGSQNTSDTAIQLQNDKNKSGMFGGLLSGAGGILSDENAKKDIKPADGKIKDFLDKAGAHEYSYKDPKAPGAAPGKHTGPMAQELEKSELGKEMVTDGPDGKGVDFQRGLGTLVAALASLNERLDKMEGVGKGKKESPKKMAAGGTVQSDQFGLPQFGAAMGSHMQQNGAPQEPEQQLSQGAHDITRALTDKFVKPYTDPLKQSISDYFTGAKNLTSSSTSTPSLGANTNLGGVPQQMTGPNLGVDTSMGASDIPSQGTGPSLGANTNLAAAPEAAPTTGLESLGGEAATDAAGSEAATAGEGAEATAGAAEAAEAGEAAEGGSAVADLAMLASKGAHPKKKVPALVSPGEAYIPPHKVHSVASGKESVRQAGEVIKGKAKVKGDSEKNDTVPKTLEAGGVVVKRTAMKDDDSAAKFVRAIMAKSPSRGMKR
jgi:hypothetical protein